MLLTILLLALCILYCGFTDKEALFHGTGHSWIAYCCTCKYKNNKNFTLTLNLKKQNKTLALSFTRNNKLYFCINRKEQVKERTLL